jgi:hypothetical protein
MKMGNYLGNAWTKYVALPILGLGIGLAVNAQRYDSDIKHYSLPDMNGDSIPEVLTTVSHRPGGGSEVCLLKSGKGCEYSSMHMAGNIVRTKVLIDDDGFFGIDIKTDEGNGKHYYGDDVGIRGVTRKQIRQALKGD